MNDAWTRVVLVLAGLLALVLGFVAGVASERGNRAHALYATCVAHHPVAQCRELRP